MKARGNASLLKTWSVGDLVSGLRADPNETNDLLLRFFAPPGGIDEDPVSVFRQHSAAWPTPLHKL